MPVRLDSRAAGFAADFETLLGSKREASEEVGATVAAILADVQKRGDAALIELTEKFDHLPLTPGALAFTDEEIAAAEARIPADVRSALTIASSGDIGVRIVDAESKVQFVPVKIVEDLQDTMWLSGIADGARVIVRGQDFVRDGQKVDAVDEPAKTAAK